MTPRCEQLTTRDEPCQRTGTWYKRDGRTGHDEAYCTQHANIYDPSGAQRAAAETRWKRVSP